MTYLVLVSPGIEVPPPHITCVLCGRPNVSRTGGTVNGTHRHHQPDSRVWCYGPSVTEKHAAAKLLT